MHIHLSCPPTLKTLAVMGKISLTITVLSVYNKENYPPDDSYLKKMGELFAYNDLGSAWLDFVEPKDMNLKSLTLNGLFVETLKIDKFPKCLEYLEILGNYLPELITGGSWPPNLTTLCLNNNNMDDKFVYDISKFGWPEKLETLNLAYSGFLSFSSLFNLPKCLKNLDISTYPIFQKRFDILLPAEYEQLHDYPYFKLPHALETLKLDNICIGDLPFTSEVTIELPETLLELSMCGCKLENLNFKFPQSLKKLDLSNNSIKQLTSYQGWQDLTSLTHLNLSKNSIEIEGWLPPPNVMKLNFDLNLLFMLYSRTPIFQSSKNSKLKLEFFSIKGNYLRGLEDIELPPLLRSLDLAGSYFLKNVNVPMSFTQQLEKLDFSGSPVNSIQFADDGSNKSSLRCINLSGCRISCNSLKFYKEMEENLRLKVVQRKTDVNSIHKFK